MFDLKVIHSVLQQLEEDRGIPKEKIIEAIEMSLASAYKKEYGKKGQIIKAHFDIDSGQVEFSQSKVIVDKSQVLMEDDETSDDETRIKFNPEHHILLEDARLIKKDAQLEEEIVFPLENKDDFGRIASQTAKQVIMQKIREAEKVTVLGEYGEKEGQIVSGTVERVERGNVFIDMGRAIGVIPFNEQIQGERFKQGERVRAYLFRVEESPRGIFLKLSRSHPKFIEALFSQEVPELATGTVEIKSIAREAGSRSKIAVYTEDDQIDPVGSLVGQRGVRVNTVSSELGGEKIDIIEWSEDPIEFIKEALSPAAIIDIEVEENENERIAHVTVSEDQQSLAIGKGGQNVRLAAKLTGWKIDIKSITPSGNVVDEYVETDTKNVIPTADQKNVEENVEESVESIDEAQDKEADTEAQETKEESKTE